MSDSFSKAVAKELGILLAPLEAAASDPEHGLRLLRYLGAPPLTDVVGLTDLAADISSLRTTLVAVTNMSRDDAGPVLVAAGDDLWSLLQTIEALAAGGISVDPDSVDELTAALARLPHFLVTRYLEQRALPLLVALRFVGVVDRVDDDPVDVFHVDRFEAFLNDPIGALRSLYGWSEGEEWDADRLLGLLDDTLASVGLLGRWGAVPDSWIDNGLIAPNHPSVEQVSVLKVPMIVFRSGTGRIKNRAGVMIGPLGAGPTAPLDGAFLTLWSTFSSGAVPVGPVDVEVPVDLDAPTIGLRVHPGGVTPIGAMPGVLRLGVTARDAIAIGPPDDPSVLITGLGAAVELAADGGRFALEVSAGVAVRLDFGNGDALMSTALGALAADAALGVRYDSVDGLDLDLAVGLEVVLIPPSLPGPLQLDLLVIRVEIAPDSITGIALVNARAELGLVSLSVEGVGFRASTSLEANPSVGLDFVPPSGIGIGIDIGPVAGGGFLSIDAPAGVYEGAIQLQVLSVGVSAFVLIETKRPDIDGWSFMMALYIEIPAIQLGFGFVLTGLGGFGGINRGVDPEALGEAVRSGSMNTVLFPDDPIADAPIIIDTLAAMFPAADGQYVFGPVVRFGWGTPQLVEVAVGVVIELPDPIRIAMIGTVDALLPRPEVALVELHLAVAGVIDFEAGTLAIDASLHNSKIVGFDLAGDMALRAAFKGPASFLFSLGGFHPDFEPPAGFPALRRLSIGLNAGPVFRVTFECYIAITSNTVQFGASFEIVARIAGFGVEGGAEFDALIQFNPFRLRTSISFYVSVTALGFELAGLLVRGDLEGPNPWHITGYAEFRALGAKKEINVDEIIGSTRPEIEPDPPGVLAQLVEALELAEAWAAGTSEPDAVTLATPEESTDPNDILVVPHGSVELGQTVVPLNETIEKFGNAEHLAHDHFRLVAGDGLETSGSVREQFAPAFFHQLKPKERLAAPSFEEMDAGLVFGGSTSTGTARSAVLGYEPILLDDDLDDWITAKEQKPRPPKQTTEIGPRLTGVIGAIGDFEPVIAGGVFSVSDPTYEVTDSITGDAMVVNAVDNTTVVSSYLGASTRAGARQVVSFAGEMSGDLIG